MLQGAAGHYFGIVYPSDQQVQLETHPDCWEVFFGIVAFLSPLETNLVVINPPQPQDFGRAGMALLHPRNCGKRLDHGDGSEILALRGFK